MRIKTSVSYYKGERRGKSPAIYKANQPRGIGTTVHAKIKLDPSLKRNPDLRKYVLLHERDEIKAWGMGKPKQTAHKIARKATTKDDRFDSATEYWRILKRREGRGK